MTTLKLLILSLGFMALILGAYVASMSRAECAFCYSGRCYNSSICGHKCACMKRGLDLHGVCVSLE